MSTFKRTPYAAKWLAGVVALGCAPAMSATGLVDSVNALRARGCSGGTGIAAQLAQTSALDTVAAQWSKGGRLQAALESTQYRATSSSSMRISGASNDARITRVLADQYCRIVTNPAFTEIGVARRGNDVWIVVAAPVDLSSVKDAKKVASEVLERVNDARSKSRRCGGASYQPVPPLQLSAVLSRAALQHAQDMARHHHFEHEGTDGSTPAQRATRVGYRWRHVAENIAAGAPTAATVVEGWLASPGHCANIMSPDYREMGIAFALNPKSPSGIYWAQVFGTQR